MRRWFSLADIKKNKFNWISDSILQAYLRFAAEHPSIVTPAQVLEKLMILDFVLPLMKQFSKGGSILEIGCGSGIHSALLSEFGRVSATELKSTVAWLGNRVAETRKAVFDALGRSSIEFRYNDGRSLPFDDATFDVVFHNSVIEHVPDVVAFNQEVHRVLRPGGICVCITGTPTLCRFRFVKYYALRFPLIAAYAVFTVGFERLFFRLPFAERVYRRIRVWHFEPTRKRLKRIVEQQYDGEDKPSSLPNKVIRGLYPRLRHFIREPEYNTILIEELAKAYSITPKSLLLQVSDHFQSPWNDLRFRLTPSTHSQHTRNYRTEIREWRIPTWIKTFSDAGFHVQTVQGYRYQQAVDLTFSDRANAFIGYHALPLVRLAARKFRPDWASEFILIASKSTSDQDSKST